MEINGVSDILGIGGILWLLWAGYKVVFGESSGGDGQNGNMGGKGRGQSSGGFG